MRPVSIKKLEPFLLPVAEINKTQEELKKPFCEIHTSEKFSVASNGAIAGVIYNSEDHDLYYEPFGNSMDMVVSLLKREREKADSSFRIVADRKLLLDTITGQFRELKAQVKEEQKVTLKQDEAYTKFEVDCKKYKLYIKTFTKVKYNGYKVYCVSSQPELEIDFQQPYGKDVSIWEQVYSTKYITMLLNFFTGCEYLTFLQDGNPFHTVRCEEENREVLLLPVRVE